MKGLLFALVIFFIPFGAFANERQREIEYEAINLVVKKYGKGLENRLKRNWRKSQLSKLV